ncbi:carboxypeptidase [Nitratireductor indicus]|uniref:carboxypeptidase n=1 Tax=Nitratireductor indicus TaxID=721133 RepID=UPI002874BE12|nr:carboxypeptidase [Nitratireductor indicus]MDS1138573.1 carboxypeptidase [Nitratireductor indicus]
MVNLTTGDTALIVETCRQHGLLRNQAAYVLATAFWETARTMKPVREYGGEKYLRSKKYYPYVGMGYVQITWLANYQKASKKLGVDFVKNPKLLLKPEYAAPILVIGSKEGWFTGKKLSDYITLSKSDFKGARRIINGTDKAAEIAKLAQEYDALLKASGYGEAAPVSDAPPSTDNRRSGLSAFLSFLALIVSKLLGRKS